jgi:hypothetical protein
MAVTVKALFEATQAPNSATTQYTTPSGTKTIIDKFTATNTTAGAVSITVYLVAASGSAGAGNTIISAKSLAAGECYTCPEIVGHTLNPSDFISTLATASASITIRASGREVT